MSVNRLFAPTVARTLCCLLPALLNFLPRSANGCDEVLGVCLRTYRAEGGALVTDVTGAAAGNLSREGDLRTRYVGVQTEASGTISTPWYTPDTTNAADDGYLQNIGSQHERDRFNRNYSRNPDHRSAYGY